MRIEVRYSVSEGPHSITIDQAQIDQMRRSGDLTYTQNTRNGTKTVTITGDQRELVSFAAALLNHTLQAE
jgi:hypothetical protein